MKSTPLPRWLVLGNSAIVIGLSAALVGVSIGGIVSWNLLSLYLGWMLLPLPLTVGSLQYAAAVRQNVWAAAVVAKFHWFACAVLSLPCFAAFIMFFVSMPQGKAFEILCGAWPFLALCIYCGFCCWTSRYLEEWARVAAEDESQAASGMRRFQFTLREMLGWIAVVSIVASMARLIIYEDGKQYEEHISREQVPVNIFQLPEGATDVCYCRGGRGYLAYEFSIDEAGFLDWAEGLRADQTEKSDAPVTIIQKGGPFTIDHYTWLMPSSASSKTGIGGTITIPRGYYYEYYKGDEGFKFAYDTATGRAYFFRF